MNIAIDSNIFIADPWLRSQHMRALMDFLEKSKSRILLSEVVEVEVKAHFRRQFSEYVNSIEIAIRQSQRSGVVGIPEFSKDKALSDTFSNWEKNFANTLNDFVLRVPAHHRIFSEIIKRAAERIPPCTDDGKGIRDAIIWLSLLDFCSRRKANDFIFISSNTKDFASSDKISLRDELKIDAENYHSRVHYFPSLDVFLKKYAEPVSHVNLEWIKAHLDFNKAESFITSSLNLGDLGVLIDKLNIDDPKYSDRFVIADINRVLSFNINDLTGFYLWRFSDDHIEARLSFPVEIKAEVESIRDPQLRLFYYSDESGSDANINSRTLLASGRLFFDISAEIKKDSLELLRIEKISRR